MTIYTVDNTQVDWEELIEKLKREPATQDFEDFKQVVCTYWNIEGKGEVLHASFRQIFAHITDYCETTQAFLLSLLFDYTITHEVGDLVPPMFEQLFAQDSSIEHEFVILRYFIACAHEGVNKALSIADFGELMERFPSEQMQAHILTQVGDKYGHNVYAEPEQQQAAIEFCREYVQHPNQRLAYVASIELIKSLNFDVEDQQRLGLDQ